MSKIRVHKEINLLPIQMGKENLVNVFYGLVEKYNKQIEYQDLIISKQELWELTGFKGKYKSEYIRELIKELTRSNTYTITETHKINGSMFVTENLGKNIKIEVPRTFQKYLFYKKDIDLMTKAKHRKKLTIQELDYWDKEGKQKSKFLVLLKKADILGINGKYNKRLYALLSQFNKTNKYISKWEHFKEVLEIPKSYQSSDIDNRIFKKAKQELLKVNLKITKITKIKKGRSIDRIEICFKTNLIVENKVIQGNQTTLKFSDELRKEIREPINYELIEYKKEIEIRAKKKLGTKFFEFKSDLLISNTFELVEILVLKYQLK